MFDRTRVSDTTKVRRANMISKAFLTAHSTADSLSNVSDQRVYFVDDTSKQAYINVVSVHRYGKDTTDHYMIQTLNRDYEIIDSFGR